MLLTVEESLDEALTLTEGLVVTVAELEPVLVPVELELGEVLAVRLELELGVTELLVLPLVLTLEPAEALKLMVALPLELTLGVDV